MSGEYSSIPNASVSAVAPPPVVPVATDALDMNSSGNGNSNNGNESMTPTMIQVMAPATLPQGYRFDAMYDGTTFSVVVPSGGVKEGEYFAAPFQPAPLPQDNSISNTNTMTTPITDTHWNYHAPIGHWKDGLFDCCRFGPLHPMLLNAWCCTPVLAGQVMTRMKLDFLGRLTSEEERMKTFRNVLAIVVTYFILSSIFSLPPTVYARDEQTGEWIAIPPSPPPSLIRVFIHRVLAWTMTLYMIVILARTRRMVRERYQIPEDGTCPTGCEDVCCAAFCACCTAAQLARHTADYETQRAMCCSRTGLHPFVPVMVV